MNPQNTHEKKFWGHKVNTHPREKILGPRNTHEKIFSTHEVPTRKISGTTKALWHGSTRSTKAWDLQNLAHSGIARFSYSERLSTEATGENMITIFFTTMKFFEIKKNASNPEFSFKRAVPNHFVKFIWNTCDRVTFIFIKLHALASNLT